MKKSAIFLIPVFCVAFALIDPVMANQTAVSINAPATAIKGSTITIKINVTHSGNSYFHFTNWVYVKVNGKEVARWDFTKDSRPENENFTREVQVKVDGPLDIESEGHCNIHGSAGISKAAVALQ